jgi:riboflavin-specific deaminase-like protein
MRVRNGLNEYNLRIVVSGSATLNPKAEIFKKRFSPIIVLASGRASQANLRRLRAVADVVEVFGEKQLDFHAALTWLWQKWNVKRLLCEGGGELNAALFHAGLVDEVYQTICPLIFGGGHAPTMADGAGASSLSRATQLDLRSFKRIGPELFLRFRAKRRGWV